MARTSSIALCALLVAGCPATSERIADAALAPDAGLFERDASLPPCPGGAVLRLSEARLTGDPSREPGSAIQDVLLDDDGGLWVLGFFRWYTDEGTGGIRRLARVDASGTLLETREVSRVAFAWNGTASMAKVGAEVWVALLDGPSGDRSVELARVGPDGAVARTSLTLIEADVGGLAIRTNEAGEPELLVTGDDALAVYRLSAEGRLSDRRAGVTVSTESRLALGIDPTSRDCLVVRDRSPGGDGVNYLFDLRDGLPTALPEPSPRASFLSVPARTESGCAQARFIENPTRPDRGGVSTNDGALFIEGWFGTTPMGMSLVTGLAGGPAGVVLATRDSERVETTNLHWVDLVGSGSCRVDRPIASFSGVLGRGVPLGAVVAVRDGERVRVVMSDLTAPGEIAWGSLEPSR
ncbi:MAG: hypothetical protein OHK0013_45770 [Sandaracinaceae bacterium]